MAVAKKKKEKVLRVNKLNLWLAYYLDETNPKTFLNKAGSARAAGYKTTNPQSLSEIGCQNSSKLKSKINQWLDEVGLSEEALKRKLLELLFAKETKFFQKDGQITETVNVENYAVQKHALEMALKIKGMFEKDNQQRVPQEIVLTRKKRDKE